MGRNLDADDEVLEYGTKEVGDSLSITELNQS